MFYFTQFTSESIRICCWDLFLNVSIQDCVKLCWFYPPCWRYIYESGNIKVNYRYEYKIIIFGTCLNKLGGCTGKNFLSFCCKKNLPWGVVRKMVLGTYTSPTLF